MRAWMGGGLTCADNDMCAVIVIPGASAPLSGCVSASARVVVVVVVVVVGCLGRDVLRE